MAKIDDAVTDPKRLTMLVRGPGGTGKSRLAASVAEVSGGKVCYFDLERRARYLPDAGGKDPALDIKYAADLETLPELVERYVKGEEAGRHDAFVLDSFAIWFSYVFSKVLKEKRVRTGRLELLDPDEFRIVKVVCQEVLRLLCMESSANVVIVDHMPSRNQEQLENEVGTVSILSASGAEFFVDTMIELREGVSDDGFDTDIIAEVRKTNVPTIPRGSTYLNPSFKTFHDLVGRFEARADRLEPGVKPEERRVDLGTLLNKARAKGITREQVVTVARSEYQNFNGDLKSLDAVQLEALMARVDKVEVQPSDNDQKAAPAYTCPNNKLLLSS